MKNYLLSTLVILFSFGYTYSQISEGGMPPSIIFKVDESNIDQLTFPVPDIAAIRAEDDAMEKQGAFHRNGRLFPIHMNMDNAGTWTNLKDGSSIWQLSFKFDQAQALNLYFDEFEIPANGKLFIYGKGKKQILGAYTQINNIKSGEFAHELILGDELTLEYHNTTGTENTATLSISHIAYIYRDAAVNTNLSNKGFGDSDNCQVNINCSPEGDNWQNEKRGAVRILLTAGAFTGWCSGSLINNVNQDCTPYLLSADHCGEGATTSQFNQWIFYFNYEAVACNNPGSQPGSNTLTGSTKVAAGGNGGSTGSDFLLLELNNSIPSSFNAYFNGWDKRNLTSSSGVSIHHPSGDIKKISTYTSNLTSSSWGGTPNTHWRVYWSSTTNGHGVTEGGSSGSPIFNAEHRIIGDLTGGSSYCTSPNSPDLYGKFSYSWQSNGTNANKRLKNWLDPNDQGLLTLNGKEAVCSNESPVAAFTASSTVIIVGETVDFTDQSSNDPNHWEWHFEGGTADSYVQQNPYAIEYNTVGTYDVRLIVWNSINFDTLLIPDYITVMATPADLDILNSSVNPSTSHPGAMVTAACTVKNQGVQTTTPCVLNFYLSENHLLDINDLLLDSMMVDTIQENQQIQASKDILIPGSIAEDNYYLIFEIDAENTVFETSELNNTAFNNFNITAQFIDLEILSFLPDSSTIMASNTTNVNYILINNGDTIAEQSNLGIYLSENNLFNTTDQLLHTELINSLEGGQSVNINFDLEIPDSISEGNYYLIAFADNEELLEESNENNNQVTIELEITHNIGIKEQLSENSFAIIPNPNNGLFTVKLNNAFTENSLITISDYTGRIIRRYQSNSQARELQIDLSNISRGTYMLQVNTARGTISKLFIVEE